jgi:hypothetical protein
MNSTVLIAVNENLIVVDVLYFSTGMQLMPKEAHNSHEKCCTYNYIHSETWLQPQPHPFSFSEIEKVTHGNIILLTVYGVYTLIIRDHGKRKLKQMLSYLFIHVSQCPVKSL